MLVAGWANVGNAKPFVADFLHLLQSLNMNDLKALWQKHNDGELETSLVNMSDEIWQGGTIEEIKAKVSNEMFTFHVALNMIGNWKGDGWHYLLCEGREFLPYIPDVLDKLGLEEMKQMFDKTLSVFPDFAQGCDDKTYIDVVNFLSNPRFKVSDERLNAIPKAERVALCNAFSECVEQLDNLSMPLWAFNAEAGGWKNVLDYLYSCMDNQN